MPATGNLPELHFEHFLGYDELTEFVTALAASRPDLVSLSSLGTSRDGRAIHLLTITDPSTGPAQDKPAYLIHGNIHAVELAGTHAALFTARQLLADAAKSDVLQRTAFYIVPRINPDGGEFAVTTSGSIRSRTDRSDRVANTLYQEDVNGDGLILTMRMPHPNGPLVADPEDPRLLIRRTRESKPPFYRTLPEGMVYDWDGTEHIAVEGRSFDWNRNWSYDWRPEPEQWGAGDFPFSETEMRALADFIFSRPSIFAILGYHTGPNAVLRPPSTGADGDLDEADVRVMRELAEIGSEHTGFPVIPVVKYRRNDARDINLRGHFHDFGYRHLGLFVFEFELGILMNSAGITTPDIFAVRSDQEHEALMRHTLAWWDQQKKRDPVFAPWTPFDHPQLGHAEIGGLLHRHVSNPTLDDLKRIAAGTYQFTLAHASRQPRVMVEDARAERIADGTYRIRARVANRGEFPTHVSNRGRGLRRLQGVRVEFHPAKGVRLLSEAGHRVLGHLGGLTDGRDLEWFVAAEGDAPVLCELRALGGAGGNVSVTVGPSD
ncbi:MAG: M14 family metallopeptidase [Armatimonadia bacterium]